MNIKKVSGGKMAFFQDKNAHFMRVSGFKVSKSGDALYNDYTTNRRLY
jgi:hypothetical protein